MSGQPTGRTGARTSRPSLPSLVLAAYPPDWRARYGDEIGLLVSDLRDHGRRPVPMAFDLLRGAAAAWLRTKRGSAMSERSRSALITVLWSWVAFAATAFWFGHDLGIYPDRPTARQIAIAHPVVPDAYHVLIGVGVVGIAATAIAAVPFAIEAARRAREQHRNSVFVLMALPPAAAAIWLAGAALLSGTDQGTADMTVGVVWLLLGLAGIAGSTQAVARIVTTTEFSRATWRIGSAAAAALTAAMLVGTGATIVWGLAFASAHGHSVAGSGWLIVTAIFAVTTGRAALALIGTRRAPAAETAVA